MNLSEITYTKIKYLIKKCLRIRWLCFLYAKPKRNLSLRNSGRSILNQSKEVLCICFVSRILRLKKKKNQKQTFMKCFDHIGGDFKAV